MRLPSVKTLRGVAGERARELRALLERKRDTRSYASVQQWEAQCFHPPKYSERLMCAINEITGGHGVEAITRSGAIYPSHEYINMGDCYTATVIRDCNTGRIFVGDIGTIIERGDYQ